MTIKVKAPKPVPSKKVKDIVKKNGVHPAQVEMKNTKKKDEGDPALRLDISEQFPDRSKVVQFTKALLKLANQSKGDVKKGLFAEDGERVLLQVTGIKLPRETRKHLLKVRLPHYRFPEAQDVCLIVKDLKKGIKEDHEATVNHFKDLLAEKGAQKGISQVISLRELKVEYKPFEAKNALCQKFDVFLADDRIVRFLNKFLGKPFYSKKRFPVPVNLMAKDLPKEVERAVHTSILPLNHAGVCSMIHVGNTKMQLASIADNIEAVLEALVARYPGGIKNIRCLHLKTDSSLAIPLHANMASANQVGYVDASIPAKKVKGAVTGELSTILGAEVTVLPNGVVKVTRQRDHNDDHDDDDDVDGEEDEANSEEDSNEDEDADEEAAKKIRLKKDHGKKRDLKTDKNPKSSKAVSASSKAGSASVSNAKRAKLEEDPDEEDSSEYEIEEVETADLKKAAAGKNIPAKKTEQKWEITDDDDDDDEDEDDDDDDDDDDDGSEEDEADSDEHEEAVNKIQQKKDHGKKQALVMDKSLKNRNVMSATGKAVSTSVSNAKKAKLEKHCNEEDDTSEDKIEEVKKANLKKTAAGKKIMARKMEQKHESDSEDDDDDEEEDEEDDEDEDDDDDDDSDDEDDDEDDEDEDDEAKAKHENGDRQGEESDESDDDEDEADDSDDSEGVYDDQQELDDSDVIVDSDDASESDSGDEDGDRRLLSSVSPYQDAGKFEEDDDDDEAAKPVKRGKAKPNQPKQKQRDQKQAFETKRATTSAPKVKPKVKPQSNSKNKKARR